MKNLKVGYGEKPRVKILDSLRGLAAVSVVLCHLTVGTFNSRPIEFTPFVILISAHNAVIFFFVLSGYVLTYQYGNDPNYRFVNFLGLRFIRLYIPYIASIALALILRASCSRSDSAFWLSVYWKEPILFKDILGHLLLVVNFNALKINGAIWSLIHEMRIALLFPLLLFITRLSIRKFLVINFIIYLSAVTLNALKLNPSEGYLTSYLYTFILFYTFMCGGLIARRQKQIITWYNELSSTQRWLFLIAGIFFYSYAGLMPRVVQKMGSSTVIIDYVFQYLVDIVITIASVIFIVIAVSAKPMAFFLMKLPLFLGRISYSLYLVHIPVGVFIVYTFANKLPVIVVIVLALVCSFVTAIIFNTFIERPVMRLGKKLLSR
ncbi:acyltransferase [Mucilaginibacter sp. UR6-11]|nr:acyltransferase [Mucilaginibacter sp. UR6-11]MCC8423797.1 acyltransferase [Mucilaginibacter sp. UR6-11]